MTKKMYISRTATTTKYCKSTTIACEKLMSLTNQIRDAERYLDKRKARGDEPTTQRATENLTN